MEWWQIQELMWSATGILVVLIAVTGFTLRFAIKPFLRDLTELRGERQGKLRAGSDHRLDRMERQLDHLDTSVTRLLEVAEFDQQLNAGPSPRRDGD
jgi:hypothetical protein